MQKVRRLAGKNIGVVLTGSHCTIGDVLPQIRKIKEEGGILYPILSFTVNDTDNRFYKVEDLKNELRQLGDHPIINTIVGAEPIGPQQLLDAVVVMPATGNTIAKMANGIVDTPALMAIKAQLRNQRPVIIAVSTNDGLGMNARNIGAMLNMKNFILFPSNRMIPTKKAIHWWPKWILLSIPLNGL